MRHAWWILLGLVAGTAAAVAEVKAGPPVDLEAERNALAQTELDFGRAVQEKGVKEGFLAYLADDSILFHPGPVPGRAWTAERPSPPIVLAWRPAFVEVSRAGDLGYTTGPFEARSSDPKNTEVGYGNYVTLWRKQPGGGWRAVLDTGAGNPKPDGSLAAVTAEHGKSVGPPPATVDLASARASLLAADNDFSRASAAKGAAAAYTSYLAADPRLLRKGAFPAHGSEAVRAALAAVSGTLTWVPASADVARSGDLGYSYGTAERKADGAAPEKSNYVRIWERQPGGDWKVVLDLLSPLPPPAPATAPPKPPGGE
ncbi:MAG TPA: nuclear transport factor 2 family protein [Thermoanaerobaculia bacterium]|nr:nuclear transport factor 2 family protein [Thermoanaerobaculia bacterium]